MCELNICIKFHKKFLKICRVTRLLWSQWDIFRLFQKKISRQKKCFKRLEEIILKTTHTEGETHKCRLKTIKNIEKIIFVKTKEKISKTFLPAAHLHFYQIFFLRFPHYPNLSLKPRFVAHLIVNGMIYPKDKR